MDASPAKTSQSPERVVFQAAVEGFFRILPPLSDRARQRFLDAGFNPDGPFVPAYTAESLQTAELVAAEECFPALPLRDGLRRVGMLQVEGFTRTAMGKALFALLRLLGRRRCLDRVSRSWRSANNYIEAKTTDVGPDVVDVWVNYVGPHPEVCLGILEGALIAAGIPATSATVNEFKFPEATYRFQWSP